MKPKKVESLRGTLGNSYIVRLFVTDNGLIDDKWFSDTFDRSKLKTYLVVKYGSEHDKYLPIKHPKESKLYPYWDTEIYAELDSKVPKPIKSSLYKKSKPEKVKHAADTFKSKSKQYYATDDWNKAQDKYVEWCAKYCKETVEKVTVGIGDIF